MPPGTTGIFLVLCRDKASEGQRGFLTGRMREDAEGTDPKKRFEFTLCFILLFIILVRFPGHRLVL